MYLEIFTPDEKFFEGEVESAVFPGADGYFQVLNRHASMISTLRSGDLKFSRMHNNKRKDVHILIEGGVVEVLNNAVSVLVEKIVDE